MAIRVEVYTSDGPMETHHDAGNYDKIDDAVSAAADALRDLNEDVTEVRLILQSRGAS